jgi:hypothetical protein
MMLLKDASNMPSSLPTTASGTRRILQQSMFYDRNDRCDVSDCVSFLGGRYLPHVLVVAVEKCTAKPTMTDGMKVEKLEE